MYLFNLINAFPFPGCYSCNTETLPGAVHLKSGVKVQVRTVKTCPHVSITIGHFTVVYLVAKPLIWSEAKGDLVVIVTSI